VTPDFLLLYVATTGIPRIPWTVLARTAYRGNSTIVLQQPVNWQPGDEIVVATTGNYLSQRESEKVVVQSVRVPRDCRALNTD